MKTETNTSHQKMETHSNQETSATPGTPERLCDIRCKICNSPYLSDIHNLLKAGKTRIEVIKIIEKEKGVTYSPASFSRHFTNYNRQKDVLAAEIINDNLIEDATKQAAHTRGITALIDSAITLLKAKAKAGTLIFDVADLDKLMKMRYQILAGEDANDNDVLAIFQKASSKYGLNMEQGILFKSPTTSKRSEVEDELHT